MDWDTRLEVSVDGSAVSPISAFTPTITTPITPIHSIEADNVGYVRQPQTATFTMTMEAMGPHVARITKLALAGTKFNIQIAARDGEEWTFSELLFRDCLITSSNPSNIVINGVPQATFNGVILGFQGENDVVVNAGGEEG